MTFRVLHVCTGNICRSPAYDVDGSALRARELVAAHVVGADLVPAGDPVERARAVVRAAATQRGLVRPDRPEDDDVADPYRGPESGFTACGALVHTTLQRPLDLLAGATTAPTPA